MSSESNTNQKNLFQTPNPTELKQAAEIDPIHDREGAREADVLESRDALEAALEEEGKADPVMQVGNVAGR